MESAIQRRVHCYFRRHGLLDELDGAGMLTWQGERNAELLVAPDHPPDPDTMRVALENRCTLRSVRGWLKRSGTRNWHLLSAPRVW